MWRRSRPLRSVFRSRRARRRRRAAPAYAGGLTGFQGLKWRSAWSSSFSFEFHFLSVRRFGSACRYRFLSLGGVLALLGVRRAADVLTNAIVVPAAMVYTAPMPVSLKARLCLMMFLNYVIWGSWYVTITTYLTQTLHFSGTAAGTIFGTAALASMISPFFIGLIADRFFATERVLAALHLIGAVLLYAVTQATSF